jgi:hypothetical protein
MLRVSERRIQSKSRLMIGGFFMQSWRNYRHYHRKCCLKGRGVLTILAILTLLGACRSPAGKFDQTAASLGLQRDVVMGAGFQHVLFWRNGWPHKTLHIYLGGDGTPVSAGRPAKDPTPRNPLMLRLMRLDPGPAVYVGRPCYHGLVSTAGCSGDFWTSARYSESVVSSLAAAIRRIMMSRGYERIFLFGHSGGGTLAMLLAERFPEVRAIVTIAANLDIDAWTDHHGQNRLTASLNPVSRPPLPPGILERHYAGSRDRIVPPTLTAPGVRGANAKLIVIEGYDHVCCWTELWPTILADIAAAER